VLAIHFEKHEKAYTFEVKNVVKMSLEINLDDNHVIIKQGLNIKIFKENGKKFNKIINDL